MDYLKCKATLDGIKADDNKIEEIISELGDGIDELFIASSDSNEMFSDLQRLRDNDFELGMWVLIENQFKKQILF